MKASPRMNRLFARGLFALLAALLSGWTSQAVYRAVPTGADENSYVFQAHNFSAGRIARPAPPLPEAFAQEMIILSQRIGWLSRYPPAHSLWLVPGVWFGNLYAMIALAAALGMWFACAAAHEVGIPEGFVGVPLLCSPFFGFMYGTLLSHTSGFAAVACMLWAYLRWRRTDRWPFAALAGLAWGFYFLNRTYTAVLIAVPFGIDALLLGVLDRRPRRWTGIALFAATAAGGLIAYLAYNRLATGDAFTATYLFYAPSEHLGFGPRRTQGLVVYHTLAKGLFNLKVDVGLLDRWLFGFKGSLIAWILLAVAGWRRNVSGLLATATLAAWLGYVYFWYPGVQDAGGPAYYFETLPMLLLLGGFGLRRLWDRLAFRRRFRTLLFSAAALLLAANAAAFSLREARPRIAIQSVKRQMLDVLRSAPPRSLVFLEDLQTPHVGEMALNPRGLGSDPLLMKSLYAGNQTAMRAFPDRTAFVLQGQQPDRLQPLEPVPQLVLGRDATSAHHTTGRDVRIGSPPHDPVRVADESTDAPGVLAQGLSMYVPRGTYDFVLVGSYDGVDVSRPSRIELHSAAARGRIGTFPLVGSSADARIAFRFDVAHAAARIEPQIHYGGSGHLVARRMVFEEVLPVPQP